MADDSRLSAISVFSLVAMTADLLLLGSVGMVVSYMSPRLQTVLLDTGAALPALTLWLLQVPHSAWLAGAWLLALGLVLKELLVRPAWVRLAANLALLLLLAAATAVYFLCLVIPMMQLITSLQ
ncbi:MAG TPA: hypothetical protein VM695_02725 [Phycisphaerae bacterium]|nr:hypothetical protein [Phycisphaerae bacterium]